MTHEGTTMQGKVVTFDALLKVVGALLLTVFGWICTGLMNQIARLEARAADHDRRLAVVETRVDGLPDLLKGIREDMRRIADATEANRKEGQAQRDELRKLILDRTGGK